MRDKYCDDRDSWPDPTGNARVEVRVVCSNDKEYIHRVYHPPDYPASCSSMIVLYIPFGTLVHFYVSLYSRLEALLWTELKTRKQKWKKKTLLVEQES